MKAKSSSRLRTARKACSLALPLLAAHLVRPPLAMAGEAVTISGTIEYTGSQGPVSAQRPILVLGWDNFGLDEAPVAGVPVESSGAAFDLTVPAAGNYYLAYVLDTNGDTAPAVGDPFEIYLDRFRAPADPIAAPAAGLALSFDDSGGLPGARGTVTYTGSMGPVGEERPLRVDVFRNGELTDRLEDQRPRLVNNGDSYQVILLDSRFHFLKAYLDLNDDGEHGPGEPFTIYDGRTAPFGDPLPRPVADVDISFGDGALPTPTPTDPSILSGTIDYTGSQGPVSAERPILVLAWDRFSLDGPPLAIVPVESSGGAFEFTVPAPGDYFLAYVLDTNGDAVPAVGDPFEIYQDRFTTPGDPISAPTTDLALSFDDTGGLPGVRGTVTYTGSMGPVSEVQPLRVDVFRNADLTDRFDERHQRLVNNGDPYQAILVDSRFHFMRAFLDLDDSGEYDPGEPFTIYNNRIAPPGDPLPQDGSMVDISFGDPPPTATPTPTVTPTPEVTPCVGDCDGDRRVTVAELVVGINIALGNTDIGACPAFGSGEGGGVTIDRLLQAVQNALTGCPEA